MQTSLTNGQTIGMDGKRHWSLDYFADEDNL